MFKSLWRGNWKLSVNLGKQFAHWSRVQFPSSLCSCLKCLAKAAVAFSTPVNSTSHLSSSLLPASVTTKNLNDYCSALKKDNLSLKPVEFILSAKLLLVDSADMSLNMSLAYTLIGSWFRMGAAVNERLYVCGKDLSVWHSLRWEKVAWRWNQCVQLGAEYTQNGKEMRHDIHTKCLDFAKCANFNLLNIFDKLRLHVVA